MGFIQNLLNSISSADKDAPVGPLEHSIDEAIPGTLEEDSDITFDEVADETSD